jgi:hypothetical protein
MCQDVCNGALPDIVAERLRCSRLVAIPKPPAGVRPIAVGEVIVRLSASLALRRVLEHLLQEFEGLQYGLSERGCESIVHHFRTAHANGDTLITLDARNAFNTLRRECIRQALETRPALSPLYPLFNSLYCSPSRLVISNRDGIFELVSAAGVRQGDVLGSALFCLATIDVLRQCRHLFPHVSVKGFVDDITMAAPPEFHEELTAAIEFLSSALGEHGLALNSKKCHVVSLHHDAAREIAVRHGFTFGATTRVLGAYVGDPVPSEILLEELARQKIRTLEQLAHISDEESFALLRLCIVPRFGFFTRIHDPTISRKATEVFDAAVWSAFCKVCALVQPLPLTDLRATLATIPIVHGGLGLRLCSPLRELAYLASTNPQGDDQKARTLAFETSLIDSIDRDAHLATLRKLNKSKNASLWLSPPQLGDCHWGRGMFAIALQQRIGALDLAVPHSPSCRLTCDCSYVAFDMNDWHQHVLGCARRKGFNASRRANMVNTAVASFIEQAAPHLRPEVEPPVESSPSPHQEAKLADLVVFSEPRAALCDWVIFNPLCSSRPTLQASERRKRAKYRNCDVDVIGTAIAANGGCSTQTLKFVRFLELCAEAPANSILRLLVRRVVWGSAAMVSSARYRAGLMQKNPLPAVPPASINFPTVSPGELSGVEEAPPLHIIEMTPYTVHDHHQPTTTIDEVSDRTAFVSSSVFSSPPQTHLFGKDDTNGRNRNVPENDNRTRAGEGGGSDEVDAEDAMRRDERNKLKREKKEKNGKGERENNNRNLNASVENQVKGVTNLSGTFFSSPLSSFVPAHLHPSVPLPPE